MLEVSVFGTAGGDNGFKLGAAGGFGLPRGVPGMGWVRHRIHDNVVPASVRVEDERVI